LPFWRGGTADFQFSQSGHRTKKGSDRHASLRATATIPPSPCPSRFSLPFPSSRARPASALTHKINCASTANTAAPTMESASVSTLQSEIFLGQNVLSHTQTANIFRTNRPRRELSRCPSREALSQKRNRRGAARLKTRTEKIHLRLRHPVHYGRWPAHARTTRACAGPVPIASYSSSEQGAGGAENWHCCENSAQLALCARPQAGRLCAYGSFPANTENSRNAGCQKQARGCFSLVSTRFTARA
jgi:hypothetical protein